MSTEDIEKSFDSLQITVLSTSSSLPSSPPSPPPTPLPLKQPTTILSLAPELHYQILDEVAQPQTNRPLSRISRDLLSTSLVCHDWHEYSLKLLYRDVEINSPARLVSFEACEGRKNTRTTHLELDKLCWKELEKQEVTAHVRKLLGTCQDLTHLEISCVGAWPWSDSLLPALNHLKYLRLDAGIDTAGDLDLATLFPNLRRLYVAKGAPFSLYQARITLTPPGLTHLELDNLTGEDFDDYEPDPIRFYRPFRLLFPAITTLTLHLNFEKTGAPYISEVLSPIVISLSKFSTLKRLELSLSPSSPWEADQARPLLHLLAAIPTKLTSLAFFNFDKSWAIVGGMVVALLQTLKREVVPAKAVCDELQELTFGCQIKQLVAIGTEYEGDRIAFAPILLGLTRSRGIRLKLADWVSF